MYPGLKKQNINREVAPAVDASIPGYSMKYLLVSLEDIENNPPIKSIVEQHAGFVDFLMMNYYIHAGNRYCSWIALQLPDPRYVNIDISIV